MAMATEVRRRRLKASMRGLIGLSIIELGLGIWLNLYGVFPGTTVPAAAGTSGFPVLLAHVAVGALLFLGALVLLVAYAWRDPLRSMRVLGVVGLLGVLGAGLGGASFVSSGYTNNRASLGMALAFLIVLITYAIGLVFLYRNPLPPSATGGGARVPSTSN
jgi:hypothetical protein